MHQAPAKLCYVANCGKAFHRGDTLATHLQSEHGDVLEEALKRCGKCLQGTSAELLTLYGSTDDFVQAGTLTTKATKYMPKVVRSERRVFFRHRLLGRFAVL
jgi:hypothetical protein